MNFEFLPLLLNVGFGLFPTFALAASIASDERKKEGEERVVASDADRRQQKVMFLLVYGLWLLTLAMWNWMRSESIAWIALWLLLGSAALVWSRLLSRRRI